MPVSTPEIPPMSDSCCSHGCAAPPASQSPRYRRVLWAALIINIAMFAVELVGGLQAGSVSLLADAVDFFGDAANYGISLLVLGMALTPSLPVFTFFAGVVMGVAVSAAGMPVVMASLTRLLPEGMRAIPYSAGDVGAKFKLAVRSPEKAKAVGAEGVAPSRSGTRVYLDAGTSIDAVLALFSRDTVLRRLQAV